MDVGMGDLSLFGPFQMERAIECGSLLNTPMAYSECSPKKLSDQKNIEQPWVDIEQNPYKRRTIGTMSETSYAILERSSSPARMHMGLCPPVVDIRPQLLSSVLDSFLDCHCDCYT